MAKTFFDPQGGQGHSPAVKKRPRFGLPCALVLSVVFAGFVSSCYFPRFIPYLTAVSGITFDSNDRIVLRYEPHRIEMATITVTLVPNLPSERPVPITWMIHNINADDFRNVVDFVGTPPSVIPAGASTSTVTIIAWGSGKAEISARIEAGGRTYTIWRYITVE
ncbi:MAG: hypothetical protein FWD88_03645 [Treponema sp.]|nr:hypothetical protein [Treponema sp.]